MRRLLPVLLVTLLPVAAEKPRVAIVDAERALTEYYATRNATQKLDAAREALKEDKRLPVIRQTREELEDLWARARDSELSSSQREQAFKRAEMKAHELRSLQRDLQQFRQAEQQKINALLATVTRKLQANVQTAITQIAQAGKFEMVFESGGDTSSQVPTLLYIREATDITDAVISHLNSTDPGAGDADSADTPAPGPPE